MNPRHALLPGILAGCLTVVVLAGWLLRPEISAQASSVEIATIVEQKALGEEKLAAKNKTQESLTEKEISSLSGQYPQSVLQWDDFIAAASEQHSLDPNLIAAIILEESNGDPQAYSRSGAVGLMQVMPRDGIAASFMCINGPCFTNRPSMQELFDPQFNIHYGTEMIASLINKNGNLREALKSYGPKDIGYQYADQVLNTYSRYQ
jgi:soluble lytic murein transglycosylase-like protein